jgi:hypothetical protein
MNDYRIEKTKDSIIDLKKDIKYIYRNLNNRISNLDKDNIVIKNNLSINDIKEKSFIDEIQKLINNTITLETEINQEIDDKEIILSNCESDNNILKRNLLNKIRLKNDEINKLKHKNFKIENYLYNHKSKEIELDQEIKNGRNRIIQLNKENEDIIKKKKDLEEVLLEVERIEQLSKKNNELLQQLKSENIKLNINLNYAIVKINKLKREISEMEIEKENIKQKIEDSKNKLIQEYENKRKENKGVNNEIILNDKQKQIEDLQKEILDLKEQLNNLESKNLNDDRDYRQNIINIENLKKKNNLKLTIYEEQIDILNKNIERLKKEVENKEEDDIELIKQKILELENDHKLKLIKINEEGKNIDKLEYEVERKKIINLKIKRDIINMQNGNFQQVLIDRQKDQEELKKMVKNEKLLFSN